MSHAPISKNHLFRLNGSISRLLMFAKPGVMSKKLLEGSVYDDRGILNEVRKAVTSQEVPESATREGGGLYMPTKGGGKRPIKAGDLRSVNAAGDARRALYDYANENGMKLDDRDKEAPVRDWTKAERQKLAQTTGTRRKMLQTIRKRESEVNGEPARKGYNLTDREKDMLNDSSKRYEKIIKSAEARDATALKERGSRYLGKLTERAKTGILRQQGGVVTANLEPDVLTKRALDVVKIVDSPMPPNPEEMARATSVLGVNERKLALMRKAAGKLTAPGSDREAIVRRSAKRLDTPVFGGAVNQEALAQSTTYPARPKGWKGPTVDATRKSFPTLKKLGIAAGLIGGGVLASKMLSGRKKKEEQKMLMSSKVSAIQFARGDKLRSLLKVGKKAIPSRVPKGAAIDHAQRELVNTVATGLQTHYRQTPFYKKLNTETKARKLKEKFDRQQAGMAKMAENIEAQRLQRVGDRPTKFTSRKARRAAQRTAAATSGAIPTRPDRMPKDDMGKVILPPVDDEMEVLKAQQRVMKKKVMPLLMKEPIPALDETVRQHVLALRDTNKRLGDANNALRQEGKDLRRLYNPNVTNAANERAAAAERGVAEIQRTYKDRVQKEVSGAQQVLGEQHKKAMFDEESRRYRHVAIGTGLGLVGGAALGSSAMREADQNKSKQKQLRFERGDYDDAKRMAISSAVTGAAGGGIVASLLRPRDGNAFRKGGPAPKAAPLRKQFNRIGKAAFKAGAFMGAAGLASSLVGRAILGKPKKSDKASATKSGALGGVIVGGLSGAVLGGTAGSSKAAQGFIRRNRAWLPIAAMGRGGALRRAAIGGTVGALVGGVQMADEGQQADTIRNLKNPVRLSSKVRKINFTTLADVAILAGAGAVAGAGAGAISNKEDRKKGARRGALIGAAVPAGALGGLIVNGLTGNHTRTMPLVGGALAAYLAHRATRSKDRDPDVRPIEVDRTGPKTIIRRVGEIRQSAKGKVIRFAEAPLSGRLAADRYRKKIQDEDLDRRDANIMRTAISGAVLGGLMKGRRGAAAGAGAGALLVPLIRTRTESGKDMYGERTREGKRAEGMPWKAAALGAGALAAHKGINRVRGVANRFNVGAKNAKKAAKIAGLVGAGLIGANLLMNSKLKTIQFRDDEDIETDSEFMRNPEGSKEWRKGRIFANKAVVAGKRGTRLAKDVVRAVKGEKNVDSRGRERQREWDKPWVRNAVLGTILAGGALASRRIVKGTAEGTVVSGWRDAVQSGELRDALTHKMPRLAKAYNAVTGYADDAVSEAASAVNQSSIAGRGLAWVKRNAAARREAKKAAARGAAGDEAASAIEAAKAAKDQQEAVKKYGKIIEGKFSKPSSQRGVIRFISNEDRAPGWDARREGDLVLLKDIRRRERREKKLLERKDWQDTVVTPAKMTASWLGGMGLMAILHKGGKISGKRTGGGAGAVPISGVVDHGDVLAGSLRKSKLFQKSAVTKDLIALSSMLDSVLRVDIYAHSVIQNH